MTALPHLIPYRLIRSATGLELARTGGNEGLQIQSHYDELEPLFSKPRLLHVRALD
jgi:hypothetical protein